MSVYTFVYLNHLSTFTIMFIFEVVYRRTSGPNLSPGERFVVFNRQVNTTFFGGVPRPMGQDSPPVFGVLGTQWFRRL